ncbi:MAG: ribonuclease R [Clostridia bacterium]|nr:ribonuclease R [Clostridia bacterium]
MKEQLLNLIAEARTPLTARQLSEALQAPLENVQAMLDALAEAGSVAATRKGGWAVPETIGLFAARVGFQRNGTPLAYPLSGGSAMTLFTSGAARCMPGDIILARPQGERCQLNAILRRGRDSFAAYVRIERRAPKGSPKRRAEVRTVATAVPCDLRIPYDVVLTGDLSFVKNDQIALLKIEKYPEMNRPIYASVLRVLGNDGSLPALMRAVAEDHGFATELDVTVEAEAREIPEAVRPEDMAGREDLRSALAFTIDGATAKDFDDAVSIERTGRGWRLGVHIADVSHYVRPGDAIDRDACARGTSLYLPGLTVPMLPECLSNNLCSLMPDVDRLALSLTMEIENGKVVDHRLVKSVIHSHARLTYAAMNRLFEGGEADIAPPIRAALFEMRALSHALRARRQARGAIDFEIDEPEFVLNEKGEPDEILCQPRGEAERIIEDFMLAANETVAALARSVELPFVYRVHEDPDPDRLYALEAFLGSLNLYSRIGPQPHPGVLQGILEQVKDHPARDVIRHHLLRALKKARYCDKPLGHYALALKDYCHFTSPIRRYPDLIVHRMLKLLIDGKLEDAGRAARGMADIASDTSAREAAAVSAERQADGIMMAAWASHQIGRKFDGVITSVTGWGFYVALPNRAEGLVHIAGLDDYYEYDKARNQLVGSATGTAFRLGDRVRVRIERASVPLGEINFELLPPRDDRGET